MTSVQGGKEDWRETKVKPTEKRKMIMWRHDCLNFYLNRIFGLLKKLFLCFDFRFGLFATFYVAIVSFKFLHRSVQFFYPNAHAPYLCWQNFRPCAVALYHLMAANQSRWKFYPKPRDSRELLLSTQAQKFSFSSVVQFWFWVLVLGNRSIVSLCNFFNHVLNL